MRWQDVYFDHSDDDPFPKMLEEEPENLLGPYVATEVGLVEKVRMCTCATCTLCNQPKKYDTERTRGRQRSASPTFCIEVCGMNEAA